MWLWMMAWGSLLHIVVSAVREGDSIGSMAYYGEGGGVLYRHASGWCFVNAYEPARGDPISVSQSLGRGTVFVLFDPFPGSVEMRSVRATLVAWKKRERESCAANYHRCQSLDGNTVAPCQTPKLPLRLIQLLLFRS